jgi:hypothetical protein
MTRFLLFVTALALVVGSMGCSGMSVNSDYDTAFDFQTAKSFSFPEGAGKGTAGVGQISPLMEKRILASIETVMIAKGFEKTSPDQADLIIVPHGATQQKTEVSSTPYAYPYSPWYGGGVDVYQYNEGTLIIDMVDTESAELVWRGSATAVVGDSPNPDKADEAVTKILAQYPPQ